MCIYNVGSTSPKWKVIPCLAVFCLLAAMPAFAQIPTTTAADPHQIPLPVLYRHFLAYQNHLDRMAASLDKKGEDGSEFRNHFQIRLGFSDSEFAPVRDTALRLETELKKVDAKIHTVIVAFRAEHPSGRQSSPALPPAPPELTELAKEREGIIEREFAQLNASLGPARAAMLQAVIQSDFAPSVRVHTVHPLPPRGPANPPLPPFPTEVR